MNLGIALSLIKDCLEIGTDIASCTSRSRFFENDYNSMRRNFEKHKEHKERVRGPVLGKRLDSWDVYIMGQMTEVLDYQLKAERQLVRTYNRILKDFHANLSASVVERIKSAKGKSLSKCNQIARAILKVKREEQNAGYTQQNSESAHSPDERQSVSGG